MFNRLKGNQFLAGSAVYLVSNILNAAIPFALLPILTRYLSPEEYGEVAMFQTFLGALAAFIGLSMQGAAVRKFYDGPRGGHELDEFIGSCLQILVITSTLTLIVVSSISSQLGEWLGLEKKWVLLAVLVSACTMVIQIRLGQWQVRGQAKRYGFLQVSQSLLNLGLSIVLVVALAQGANGWISAQVWTSASFALLALWFLKREALLKLCIWKPKYICEALRFGVPLIPHVAGMFLLASADRFVINSELGLSETGIYMVAVQFSAAFLIVFDAVNKAFVPWLFERLKSDLEHEKRQIVRFTYAWFALILSGGALAFLVGPWLITLVAGEAFAKAGDVIGWLALGQVFCGMYLMVTNYIFFSKRTGLLSLVTVFSGLINVGLLLLLIGKFGLKGAAYAFCIAMAIRFILAWWVAQKRHPMPWFEFKKL